MIRFQNTSPKSTSCADTQIDLRYEPTDWNSYWANPHHESTQVRTAGWERTSRRAAYTFRYLRAFLSDGDLPMDNNYAEQTIPHSRLGKKLRIDWIIKRARASAMFYSLVETAKAPRWMFISTLSYCSRRYQNTWTTPLLTSSMTFFLWHLLFRRFVQVDLRNLNFSKCKNISKSDYPLQKCGFLI